MIKLISIFLVIVFIFVCFNCSDDDSSSPTTINTVTVDKTTVAYFWRYIVAPSVSQIKDAGLAQIQTAAGAFNGTIGSSICGNGNSTFSGNVTGNTSSYTITASLVFSGCTNSYISSLSNTLQITINAATNSCTVSNLTGTLNITLGTTAPTGQNGGDATHNLSGTLNNCNFGYNNAGWTGTIANITIQDLITAATTL